MYQGENDPTILHIILLYLVFFILLYPTTCILIIANIAKKPKWYISSAKGVISLAFNIMLSYFKFCFIAWVVSAAIGAILGLTLWMIVGVICKLGGYDMAITENILIWTQIIMIAIGQIVGYIITIRVHNSNV